MRPRGAWLLFAGLAALVVAATFDALPKRGREPAPPPATSAPPAIGEASAAAELRQRGVTGTLYVTERRGRSCRLHALRLPDLAVEADVERTPCRVEAGPNGRVALGSGCPGAPIEVRDSGGELLERPLDGCSPAWSPRRELTFLKRGEIVAVDDTCPLPAEPCFRGILSRDAIQRQLRAAGLVSRSERFLVREIGWLGSETLALVVRPQGDVPTDFAAVFVDGRLRPAKDASISLADRAFTRSPDGRWTARASRNSVYVFSGDRGDRASRPVELDLRVVDLAWG